MSNDRWNDKDEEEGWAYGHSKKGARSPLWPAVLEQVKACNGEVVNNKLSFTSFEGKQKFDAWYSENAPTGLRVRSVYKVAPAAAPPPIPMILFCPKCGQQHIDEPDGKGWDNPPHRSHLCHSCGFIWRPADVATTGVVFTKTVGTKDKAQRNPAAPAVETPEVTSLLADIKRALQMANKVGDSSIPFDQATVGGLVSLQVSIEDRIKALGAAKGAATVRQLHAEPVLALLGSIEAGLIEITGSAQRSGRGSLIEHLSEGLEKEIKQWRADHQPGWPSTSGGAK